MAHTQGEWEISEGTKKFFIWTERRSIAGTWGNEKQDFANAQLIKAAPDMLEALEDAQDALVFLSSFHERALASLKKVNAAIKKAKGE